MRNFFEIAVDYAKRVVAGQEVEGNLVRLACRRFLHDLETAADRGLVLDQDAAQDACEFLELVPHVKGEWASRGERITLGDWQVFATVNLVGWKWLASGYRRFRVAWISMARKNAKTTWADDLVIYLTFCEGEAGAEGVIAATGEDQAFEVWDIARTMIRKAPSLREAFGIEHNAERIFSPASGSHLRYLTADPTTHDGLNLHVALCDEVHAHPTPELWNVLETAMGARRQPLMIGITTAPLRLDDTSLYAAQSLYAEQVLEGHVQDDGLFALVYTLDRSDDPFDPSVWRKANPLLGVSVFDLPEAAARARTMPTARASFLAKRVNRPASGAASAWLDPDLWTAAVGARPDIDDAPCWLAFDFAQRADFIGWAQLFRVRSSPRRYYLRCGAMMPGEALRRHPDHLLLRAWAETGHIEELEELALEEEFLADRLAVLAAAQSPRAILYDPWKAGGVVRHLLRAGLPAVEKPNTVSTFSPAMHEFEALLAGGNLTVEPNPVTDWMFRNIHAERDVKGNLFPRKIGGKNSKRKIDGAVAALMCLSEALADEGVSSEDYAEAEIL